MIAARSPQWWPAAAAGWLQPIPQLGIDGAIAVIALLMAHDPLMLRALKMPADDNTILGYWSALTLVLACLLSYRFGIRWLGWSLRHLRPILLVLLIALASPLWSLDPAKSGTRAIWLLESSFLGFFIGYRFYARDQMAFLFVFFVVLLASSVGAAFFLPDVGVLETPGGGAWTGLVVYKNTLGYLAALAVVFFLIAVLYGRMPRIVGVPLLALAIYVLASAKSASGLVVTLVSVGLIVILWIGKQFRISALLAVILMIASPFAMLVAVVNAEKVATFMDRDPTMTGRTKIWADAVKIAEERPLIGFGLEAIWGKKDATPFPYRPTTRIIAHAHNGYLDIADELGVPVAALATGYFLYLLFIAFDTYLSTRSSVALFAFVALNAFMIYNLVEVGLFEFRRMEWITCVAIIVAMLRRATHRPSDSRPAST